MGGQRPGHEHARGSCLRTGGGPNRPFAVASRASGPYRGPCTDASRPGATAPTGAGAQPRAPGRLPPMPCREVRGTLSFHISVPRWRILGRWPPPRSTFGPRSRRAGAGCARRRRPARRSCARGRRRRLRDHLRPLLPRPAGVLRPHAGQPPGGGGRPAADLRLRLPGVARGAGEIDLRPWLYTIASNRCLSVLRARARRSPSTGSRPRGAVRGHGAQIQQRADLRDLVEELQRLPDDQRAALVLFELGDESHEQIAAVLGVRREKVKALVFQAREALLRARARARGSLRGDPRGARDPHRPGAEAQHAAQPHRPLPGLCRVRARGAPSARGARGDPALGADGRPEGLRAGLLARRRRRGRLGRRGAAARRSPRAAARGRERGGAGRRERPGAAAAGRSAPPARRRSPLAWPPAAARAREPSGQGRRGEDPGRDGAGRRRRAGPGPHEHQAHSAALASRAAPPSPIVAAPSYPPAASRPAAPAPRRDRSAGPVHLVAPTPAGARRAGAARRRRTPPRPVPAATPTPSGPPLGAAPASADASAGGEPGARPGAGAGRSDDTRAPRAPPRPRRRRRREPPASAPAATPPATVDAQRCAGEPGVHGHRRPPRATPRRATDPAAGLPPPRPPTSRPD